MKGYLHILSGARAGTVFPLEEGVILVGRRVECHLRFDPQKDLDVSGLHAGFEVRDDGWWLRDFGSRNGTWVNGERVEGERLLRVGDRIAFGIGGPQAEFRAHERTDAPPTNVTPVPETLHGTRSETPSARIRAQVRRQTSALRYLSVVLFGLVAALAVFMAWSWSPAEADWEEERERLARQVDSLLAESDQAAEALEDEMAGLQAALRASQAEVRRIQRELEARPRQVDDSRTEVLRRELLAARTELERQQLAASLDFNRIAGANRRAVALLYVEWESGGVSTGTAFAVRPDATLVTSLHVLEGASGDEIPRRIGVQFADSDQVWPARVLASSEESTLAVIKVDLIEGDVPTVSSLNPRPDTLANGAPLALIGYPLGGDLSGIPGAGARVARPLVTAGVLSLNDPDFMEIQGHGDQGASGSPIFDETGSVVAILFGGRHDATRTVLLAVPSDEAIHLLAVARPR
jgi:S1-C subfamily serine protease